MVERLIKHKLYLFIGLISIGAFITCLLAAYITSQNKDKFYYEKNIIAENKFHYLKDAYAYQSDILDKIIAFYNFDSQVRYEEFSDLVSYLIDQEKRPSNALSSPLEIGWFAQSNQSNKNIVYNYNDRSYVKSDKSNNQNLNYFSIWDASVALHKSFFYKDGIQLITKHVMGKIPDEENMFDENGYFYIVIDIQALLNFYQSMIGEGYKVHYMHDGNDQTEHRDFKSYLSKETDFIAPGSKIIILHEEDWNSFSYSHNFSGIFVFIFGLLGSVGLAKYLSFILQQKEFYKESGIRAKVQADLHEKVLISMLDALPITVFGKDVQDDYTYSFINKEAERFFGMSKKYMLGKNDFNLWPSEEADWFRKTDVNVVEKGEIVDIPCEQVTPAHGDTRLVHTRKVPIFDENNNPIILLGVLMDITDRVYNEKELERHRSHLENMVQDRTAQLENALEKANEFSRMKSDFLATMSHEIRTPMNGILGMAELIQNADPTPQISRYSKIIINSGETLQQVINDILDFSKIEAGKLNIQPMPVNVMDIVYDVARLYDLQARDKALEIVVSYKPGTEQFFYADPVRLQQILGNLLSNAIKFTDKGYVEIVIERNPEAVHTKDVVELKFSVKDTGIGISKKSQLKIFDKFTQGDSSTTREFGGTGLGLSICKSLVELMKGSVGLMSKKGEGSTFWFSIPLCCNHKEVYKAPKPPILKDIKILVVDDVPVICDLLQEQLNNAGMTCDKSLSGKEAIRKMKEAADDGHPYQIVIIDYLMPQMNGDALARAINDHPDLRDACLIMQTSVVNQISDYSFEQKGFSAYLTKPISSQTLIESLATIWERYSNGETSNIIPVDLRNSVKDEIETEKIHLQDIKILVAEDNLVNQFFIQEILDEMSAQYKLVCNGQEALDLLLEESFDLVIMDCLMPVMDGFEATQKIRQLEEEGVLDSGLPILALTANAMEGDREKCLQAGMDSYLPKPVRQKELKEKILELLKAKDDEERKELPAPELHHEKPAIPEKESIATVKPESETLILDYKAIKAAKDILKEKYAEVVTIYIDSSFDQLEEIMQAYEKGSAEDMIRPAHTLKSASKRMGANKLSEIAAAIEIFAKNCHAQHKDFEQDNSSDINIRIQDMKSTLNETEKAFKSMAA